ncbi:hypothetical protein D172_010655 [Pseudoalteromonas sp. Bsw20308]|uniref:hypothetical protein n=1 Tax=unclassified Pseudoalteromonas TaxID=194690 RepID=UPI000231578A|nr:MULTISPECIES: hypothetical protein [unclassified Pseudoalteromonas]ALQ08485.1 hypothetical protein D172_010655 [Pseudoalteromonas sp. Bsw20308]GAA79257.1 hypothetical protein P20495_1755 [Pseudoalteromonas sp. BSi20495]
MTTIKDQDLFKKQNLVRNIIEHAIDQANFTIRNLNKRPTVAMLMECENCLTDFLPIVRMIVDVHDVYAPVYDQMQTALDAAQIHGEPALIELTE